VYSTLFIKFKLPPLPTVSRCLDIFEFNCAAISHPWRFWEVSFYDLKKERNLKGTNVIPERIKPGFGLLLSLCPESIP